MALVPILFPPGIERNGTAYDTPGRWWDMSLMRWQSSSLQPIGGWERLTSVKMANPARKIFTWRDNANMPNVLVGTDTQLWADYGGYTNITPVDLVPPFVPPVPTQAGGYGTGPYDAGAYGTPRPPAEAFSNELQSLWSMDNWGEDVFIVASSDGRLLRYGMTDTPPPDLGGPGEQPIVQPGAPVGNVGVVTTEERYVMLIGTSHLGTYYPRRIAWCSQENPADWDYASLTNTAGFLDLDATSPLMRGVRVQGGILVLSATDIFLVQYNGLPYVYGAQRVGRVERLHPNTVATWDGKAMWWTSRGFQTFQGGYTQPIDCPIFNDLRNDLDPTWGPLRSHAAHNGAFPEIWFFYPSHGHKECNRYVAYNYIEAYWLWGELSRSAMVAAGATPRPIMGGTDSHLYEHEAGWTAAGTPILGQRWLETGALGIGDGAQLVEVRRALLATDSPGCVDVRFYGRLTPDGVERVFGPYVPRADGYTDTRVNAREARVRYTGRIDAPYSVGMLRLELAPGGTR